ncbi:YdcF family protein [Catenovulum sp. SM1970]|uniref:ElyC/SanA/YdcF family protein n=1 Tax=Marinifaba aquimaris TaxID=2741323 RepID=UPI0015718A2B|nr:ElyC/SanA/YdcF family protein [Marinifaba aquimaris]NTS77319.1 YdcF family protein [Marinifaba aquimaris]
MLFILKKLIAALLSPLVLIITGLLLAFVIRNRKPKISKYLTLVLATCFILISTPWFPNYLINNLENKYPVLFIDSIDHPIDYIVVLGCGHKNDEPLPITSQLASCSLTRTVEGVRIANVFPNAKLIFTGYEIYGTVSNAQMNEELALDLNIDSQRIIIFDQPKDTHEEVLAVRTQLKGQRFILVTEASHMPRAINYFKAYGLNPIASPTHHRAQMLDTLPWYAKLPSSHSIALFERVWYEYLGLIQQFILLNFKQDK